MIPKILWTIDWINLELDEESREDFTRLKKVQDNKKIEKAKEMESKLKHQDKQMDDDASSAEEDLFVDTAAVDESDDDDVFV